MNKENITATISRLRNSAGWWEGDENAAKVLGEFRYACVEEATEQIRQYTEGVEQQVVELEISNKGLSAEVAWLDLGCGKLRAEVESLRFAIRPFADYAKAHGVVNTVGRNGAILTGEDWRGAIDAARGMK